MSGKKKFAPVIASIALMMVALSGCSLVIEDDPKGHGHSSAEVAPEAPDATEPVTDDTAGTDKNTDSTEKDDTSKKSNDVDLSSENGTVYLQAQQAFSPLLATWTVEDDLVHYKRVTCIGTTDAEGYASLAKKEPSEGAEPLASSAELFVATWEGENPQEHNSLSDNLEIGPRTLMPQFGNSQSVASAHSDIELKKFTKMCMGAGQAVASFIF